MLPRAASSQSTQASLAVGVGTVRHDSGSRFSVAAISPALRFESSALAASFDATIASQPGGAWSTQGRADVWVATPPVTGNLRLGLQVVGAGTTRTGSAGSAAAHGVAELLWSAPTWGVGVGAGPSAGWIAAEQPVTAWRARLRVWGRRDPFGYSLNVEPTRFLGAWFTDVSAGGTWSRGAVSASAWGTTRQSAVYGASSAAGAFAQLFVTSRLALELGGGTYLREPYQGLPRAAYGSLGIRLHAAQRAPTPVRPVVWPPLTPERRGDSVHVRFRMDGATSLAIAGEWDEWQPRPLQSTGGAQWEGRFLIRPGTYRFNLVVDGKQWVVPGGVATIKDDLGGLVALLLVN